ncbi:hypothetical protein BS50DRAFT_336299 [Corynespora cassiicola Philippines]|uniref:Uncharacterized protein n=1 Tax=Corynespora cassiicola Philippines TaxID=1448308 RepID=A0A2T2NUW5_CORCC|nr:hypothetical protein BS50DRAFT_336299 [Corynespora cassiicola Philippines]
MRETASLPSTLPCILLETSAKNRCAAAPRKHCHRRPGKFHPFPPISAYVLPWPSSQPASQPAASESMPNAGTRCPRLTHLDATSVTSIVQTPLISHGMAWGEEGVAPAHRHSGSPDDSRPDFESWAPPRR